MTVKIEIELDLPEPYQNFSGDHLTQLIFDEIINHAACSHLRSALEKVEK